MKILTLLLMVVALDCLANLDEDPLAPAPEHTSTTRSIVYELVDKHYVSRSINDVLSSKIFDAYLQNMDPGKSYLLQSDIDDFEIYRYELDDALRKGNLAPAYEMWNRYQDRWETRLKKVIDVLGEGIDDYDFTKDEEFLLDRSDSPWATSDEQLDELWKKRIKLAVLNLRLADKEHHKIQETLLKRYQHQLRMTSQTRREDVYQLYINSFTETYDPHTQYFSPRNTENFNINMSLSLEGIGAVLQQDVEFTKVVNLVTAGPADKSGLLKPNDKIIGVGQGAEGEIVDVIGWRLSDVVQLIRGKKNTIVRLDIIPADAEALNSKIIQITRNTVKLEEQTASSSIIELEQLGETHKLGIIDIPTFYSDFKALKSGDRDYRSTTRDVQRLLKELIAEKVDGIIIDLRNNGGGSLEEARNMTGLFIDRGPIVQIRYKNSRVYTMKDNYPGNIYDGPLAVVVNRLSASASEIFAGAIQDYQRGIVVGTPTFGKGTVQTIVPLPSSHGQLKLTQAKFYRISGDS
ncbi:MAG: S41 family peptidase, partial [Gammaproteobacteria bacterium]|nr:S41 family peptidase [Gammaproteobacteria bacterium]